MVGGGGGSLHQTVSIISRFQFRWNLHLSLVPLSLTFGKFGGFPNFAKLADALTCGRESTCSAT